MYQGIAVVSTGNYIESKHDNFHKQLLHFLGRKRKYYPGLWIEFLLTEAFSLTADQKLGIVEPFFLTCVLAMRSSV